MMEESWSREAVQISNNRVTVQEANCSVVITEKGSIVKTATDATQGANILHSKKCSEAGCAQCLFYYLDLAKRKGSEEKIGRGAQGSIYRFRAPGYQKKREYFVRKEITITPGKTNLAPVAEMVLDETEKHGVAASVEGEVNRLFSSSPHFVRLFGIRLSGTEKKTIEFVLEYMELALSDLQSHVALIDQRILNRISTRFPPSFPGEGTPLASFISAAISIVAVASASSSRYLLLLPYFKKCRCKCTSHTQPQKESDISLLDSSTAGTLPESVLLNIFKQITCGLQRMSQCSIIHKDVKPSNILVNRFGRVKLADFGTSKRGTRNEGITHAMSPYIMCTRIYKAPELAGIGSSMLDKGRQGLDDSTEPASTPGEGVSHVTSAADVWSLGLTLLVLATPHRNGPWPDDFVVQRDCLFHPSCIADFRVPATLSPNVVTLIRDCLTLDSHNRPTAEQLLEHPSLPEKCSCKGGGHDRQEFSLDKFLEYVNYMTYPFYEAKRIQKVLRSLGIRPPPGRGCDRFPVNFPHEYSKWCSQTLFFLETLRQGLTIAVSQLEIPMYPTPKLRNSRSSRSLHRRPGPFMKSCHHVVMHSVAEAQQSQTEELVTVTNNHIHALSRLLKSLRKRKDILIEIESTSMKTGSSHSDSPRLRMSTSVSDSDFESLSGYQVSDEGDDYPDSSDLALDDSAFEDRILRLSYIQHVQAERKQSKTTKGNIHKGSTHSNKRNYSYLSPHSTFDGIT